MRLDLPAGTAVRFEPGEIKTVQLVALGGYARAYGGSGLVDGAARRPRREAASLDSCARPDSATETAEGDPSPEVAREACPTADSEQRGVTSTRGDEIGRGEETSRRRVDSGSKTRTRSSTRMSVKLSRAAYAGHYGPTAATASASPTPSSSSRSKRTSPSTARRCSSAAARSSATARANRRSRTPRPGKG